MEMALSTSTNKDIGFSLSDVGKQIKTKIQGIYMIKCVKNNKIYVGQGIDIRRRLLDHKRELKKGTHTNSIMQNTYNKYGEDSFLMYIVEIVEDVDQLSHREAYWCKHYDTFNRDVGFNICPIVKDEFERDDFSKKVMGSKNGKAKLSEKEVIEICNYLNKAEISVINIATLYGVKRETIKDIRKGRTWKQVTGKYISDDIKKKWKKKP